MFFEKPVQKEFRCFDDLENGQSKYLIGIYWENLIYMHLVSALNDNQFDDIVSMYAIYVRICDQMGRRPVRPAKYCSLAIKVALEYKHEEAARKF